MINIPLDLLDPHPHNPRGPVDPDSVQELADSIREKGIVEPLIVVPVRGRGTQWKIERYTVIAGHRRLAAARLAGLAEVPAIARDLSPIEQEEIMLVENLQREDLSLLQEARAFQRLIDGGMSQMDVARKLGIGSSRIQQRITILKLPAAIQEMFDQGELPITAAPLLTKIESIDRQERLAQMVASRRLTVPKLEEMVDREIERVETDKAVEKSRSNGKEKRRAMGPVEIYTRADAVRDLESKNGKALTFADLRCALEDTCEKCGMEEHPMICNGCPLPQLINNLVKRGGDEAHEI